MRSFSLHLTRYSLLSTHYSLFLICSLLTLLLLSLLSHACS